MTLQTTASIAAEVRGFTAKRQLKQSDLAVKLHVSVMAISRRMRGEVSFTAEEMLALSEILQVPVCALYGVPDATGSAPAHSLPPNGESVGASSSLRAA